MLYSLCTLLRVKHTPKAVPGPAHMHAPTVNSERESFRIWLKPNLLSFNKAVAGRGLGYENSISGGAALTQVKIRIECAKSGSRSISAASSIHQQAAD